MVSNVYLGLGSNLGDRASNLIRGLDALESISRARVLRVSSIYETEPRACGPQPDYLNAAAELSWSGTSHELMRIMLEVELHEGRVRTGNVEPRSLDIDLLLNGSEIIDSVELVLPHPRLHERLFVLAPLSEIAPDLIHPVLNRTISELLRACPDTGRVIKVGEFPTVSRDSWA